MRHLVGNTGFVNNEHRVYILPGALKPASSRLPVVLYSFGEPPSAWATDLREESGHDLSMEISWIKPDTSIIEDEVDYGYYANDIDMFVSRRGSETIRVVTSGTIRAISISPKQTIPRSISFFERKD